MNDGSTIKNIQIVYKKDSTIGFDTAKQIRTGAAVMVNGITKENIKTDLGIEIIANKIELLKQADEDFPIQTKQHSLEFLRDLAHLRIRTTTISAIMKVRSELAYAIHKFFNENGFV